jgi:hypothetical protein
MTRYHFFNAMYPRQSADLSEGLSVAPYIVWNAFTRVTGLDRFFRFTPSELNTADQAGPEGQGTDEEPFYSDQIGIE